MENNDIFAVFVETWDYGVELCCYCEGEDNAKKLSQYKNNRGRFDRAFRRAFYKRVVIADVSNYLKEDFPIFVRVDLPNDKGKACGLREYCWTSTDSIEKNFPLAPMGIVEEQDYHTAVRFRVPATMFKDMSDKEIKEKLVEIAQQIKAGC